MQGLHSLEGLEDALRIGFVKSFVRKFLGEEVWDEFLRSVWEEDIKPSLGFSLSGAEKEGDALQGLYLLALDSIYMHLTPCGQAMMAASPHCCWRWIRPERTCCCRLLKCRVPCEKLGAATGG